MLETLQAFVAALCVPPADRLRHFEETRQRPANCRGIAQLTATHSPDSKPQIALLVYSCCAKCTEGPPQRPRWWSTILSMCQAQLIFTQRLHKSGLFILPPTYPRSLAGCRLSTGPHEVPGSSLSMYLFALLCILQRNENRNQTFSQLSGV